MTNHTKFITDAERQERFMAVRQYLGLTQRAYGQILGLKGTAVFTREHGEVRVLPSEINLLANHLKLVYGVNLDDVPRYVPRISKVKTNLNSAYHEPTAADLRKFRDSTGMTQLEVAKALDLPYPPTATQAFISAIELDKPRPSARTLKVYEAYAALYKENKLKIKQKNQQLEKPFVDKGASVSIVFDKYNLRDPEDRAYLLMRIEQLERINND